jgi:ketosteroid isomerase-like protein
LRGAAVGIGHQVTRKTVDEFYRAWLGRDLDALAKVLDEHVRWSTPPTLPGGGVRRGRRAVLEQAALVFERFPTVELEEMLTSVAGDWATVRGRYRTAEGRRVDFVDRMHVRDGRIVSLRANMRADQVRSVARERARRR